MTAKPYGEHIVPSPYIYLIEENVGTGAVDVSYEQFASTFTPPHNEINVMFDFNRLESAMAAGDAAITLYFQRSWDTDTLYAPWYRNEQGQRVDYNTPHSIAWNYTEISSPSRPYVEAFDRPYPMGLTQDYWRTYADNVRVATINVDDGRLVLDGNHRLADRLRRYTTGCTPLPIPHYRIQAPKEIGGSIVPDVLHWVPRIQ